VALAISASLTHFKIRSRWFIFDALRKLHEQARLKVRSEGLAAGLTRKDKFEALDQIFGKEAAEVMRHYMEHIEVRRNQRVTFQSDYTHILDQ
jgi:hypothetical protein